jgi:hypothetical protein
MAWYDDIANTTKGNVQGLVNALSHPVDTAKAQFQKGAPYRQALASALQGDMSGANQALSNSELTPSDFGMMLSTIKGVGKNIPISKTNNSFQDLSQSGKMNFAKNKTQELNDLLTGKSKFAEVRLNWDDPKTYDLADQLKSQGFDSTLMQQGPDTVTLFHKASEDISPILNAKTPYDFGKAYGYSDADIAHFYKKSSPTGQAEVLWNQDLINHHRSTQ